MPEDEKYDVLEKIGHGSFGIIRKVKRRSDNYVLCRKEISYSKMSQKEKEQLQAELSILKELRHPNIVAYYEREHIKASQDLYLYMEYCGNGDLGKVINTLKSKNQLADEEFVWSIFSQLVGALYRCHYGEDPPPAGGNVLGLGQHAKPQPPGRGRPMILHRDLKPENIFLGQDNSVKLGDFGLSKIMQSHDFASTYVGTPFYMSPEICKAETYTLYSDIWALGCIVYELCSKSPPFNAKTHFELIQKIKAGRYPEIPAVYSPELKKIIQSCLKVHPNERPDTATLLNLPIVKLMRKEQEVVQLGQQLREQKQLAVRSLKEAEDKLNHQNAYLENMRKEIDSGLRREWELKARLEIDRQVALEKTKLQERFEDEVARRVANQLAKINGNARRSSSPRPAPRSSTPTMQPDLFPSDILENVGGASTSTLGTASDFASGTDLSSLSLDEPVEETVKPKPARKPRQPLNRARTMFAGPAVPVPPSPMDVQMGEPSPAPGVVTSLSLSPRRAAPKGNIFAAAKDGATKWEPEDIPPSPIDEDFNADEEDDGFPILPSPTRAKSATGMRNGNEDPFKVLAAAQRPLKVNQRLASAPSLAPKSRPQSAVPVAATSPERRRVKPAESGSPTRKTFTKPLSEPTGLKSKKGNDGVRMQAIRNNGLQGRTLVELQQARGIPVPSQSDDERTKRLRSPVKAKSATEVREVAVWDPEVDDMPSPFLVKSKKMVR